MPNEYRTTRKVGIEMEGYMRRNPQRVGINGATLKHDASLAHGNWSDLNSSNGVEVVSRPLRDLSKIGEIFDSMHNAGWHVDTRAGTHVHVDISDYTEFDKAKLLRFCKGIERIMYMFVKTYRAENRYAQKLQEDWRKIFKPIEQKKRFKKKDGTTGTRTLRSQRVDWDRLVASGRNMPQALQAAGLENCQNSKYYWLNIYGSRHGTAEFRIFHAVENRADAMNFARMAHNIVEVCKHASVEQLEFIIMSLYESENIAALKSNFFYVLGLPEGFELDLRGLEAKQYMEHKLQEKASRRARQIQNQIRADERKVREFVEAIAI